MAGKKWSERNYLFALFGSVLFGFGLFAIRSDGVRTTIDTVALYAGIALCFIQIVIWIAAIASGR
jgi:hypothetical protein